MMKPFTNSLSNCLSRLPLVVLLCSFSFLSANCSEPETVVETIVVHADQVNGPVTYRASGLLSSVAPDTPDISLVAPLKPRMMRMHLHRTRQIAGILESIDYARILGCPLQLVISDSYAPNIRTRKIWPGDNGDWSLWDTTLRDVVNAARDKGFTGAYDVFNEPDSGMIADHPKLTREQRRDRFFELWARSYRIIKQIDPKSIVLGPSSGYYDWPPASTFSIREFVTFAAKNNVMPDILAWHELWNYGKVVANVKEIRQLMKELGVPEAPISINEYVNLHDQTKPGILPWYFSALEEAKVLNAAHSCWGETYNGITVDNGWTPTLDGLLTWPEQRPKSTWWVYHSYGDMTGNLLGVTPGSSVGGVASVDPARKGVFLLLGREKFPKKSDGSPQENTTMSQDEYNVKVVVNALPPFLKTGKVRAVCMHIADSGSAPSEAPRRFEKELLPRNDSIELELPDFGPSDAYYVKLLPVR